MAAPGTDPLDALPPRSGRRSRPGRIAGRVVDALLGVRQRLTGTDRQLDRLAAETPRRQVAVLGVYGERGAEAMGAAVAELRCSRHEVTVALGALGVAWPALGDDTRIERMEGGRLANLNRLAAAAAFADWVLLLDDDVALPSGFFERLVALAERFDLQLAQPALSRSSHTAWPLVRRRPDVLRQTSFVEMGPALLMRAEAFAELVPFPEEGMGWGVDLHWAAVAKRKGWALGVADAVPVRHDLRAPAAGYDRADARVAAAELLADREHIGWREAATLRVYRSL